MTYEELNPKKIFHYFRKISDIPRGSGNEEAVAKYVYDTACALGYEAVLDSANNVFVTAPATPGYEDHAPIMLQGHLDMVCEANKDTEHDFLKDPIKFILDGDLLRADGTTLGADNGVAVAIMLSVLDSDLPHPMLEFLFTTDEETGMGGMSAFDTSLPKSTRLLNLDSAGEGVATVSCAGGVRSHIYFNYDSCDVPANYSTVKFEIGGLFGGHSGEDINLGRIGSIATAGRIIYHAMKSCDIRVASIEGGSRDNAIPRECSLSLAVSDRDLFLTAVREEETKIRGELVEDDRGFFVKVSDEEKAASYLSQLRSGELIAFLVSVPNGVHGMSRDVEGLVETSSNLAVVRKSEDGCEIVISSRSSVSSRLDNMQERIECAARLAAAKVEHVGRYPGWDYMVGSPMQELYLKSNKELFSTDASVMGIHAGLECGLLKGKRPEMDIISIGPDLRNLHSPDEVLSVSSFARLWDLVCKILENA
ncbi:MAG: aminoacyl-histidine dipeptidase [Ruminococcaceae bacterium]|nr:aminoacyl-histidine dipeptidase [Oscillospiraceae bacterium]